jgi:hypothetical protein
MDGIIIDTTHGKMWVNVHDIMIIIEAGEYSVIKMHGTDRDITALHSFTHLMDSIRQHNNEDNDDDDDLNRLLDRIN